jgi:hypothetical protein
MSIQMRGLDLFLFARIGSSMNYDRQELGRLWHFLDALLYCSVLVVMAGFPVLMLLPYLRK